MRDWDCVTQMPGTYPRQITKSTRQADHWNKLLAHLDHGHDHIFDFIYGVKDRKVEPPVKQTHQVAQSDDTYSLEATNSRSGSEIKDSCGSTPNDDPNGKPIGFAI